VKFVSKSTGFIQARNIFFKTTDAGDTWIKHAINDSIKIIGNIFFLDSLQAWAVGDSSFYETLDGGVSWIKKFSRNYWSYPSLASVYFLNKDTGWITITTDDIMFMVFSTTDGGGNWSEWDCMEGGYFDIMKVYFTGYNNGYILGDHISASDRPCGAISQSIDGGKSFGEFQYFSDYPDMGVLNDITFTDSLRGYCVGGRGENMAGMGDGEAYSGGMILRTIDGGKSWQEQNYEMSWGNGIYNCSQLSSVSFPTPQTGYAVGSGILKTSDAGDSWSFDSIGISYSILKSVFFTDENHGWAVGDGGMVLRYSITEFPTLVKDKSMARKFELSQNYPNPFNPYTVISYSVPITGLVELKVYDLLGREIALLVSEVKPAGDYKTVFNGSNLQSGVYFYKLKIGSRLQTRKMILLK
jgi:photosystem II stability/assembly factor-like uncharacterized protein